MTSRYRELLSNTIIFTIGTVGSRLITFFLVPLYTNVLTTGQYGTADLVMTCSNLIVPIISLVIQDAVLRFGLTACCEHGKIAKNALVVFCAGTIFTLCITPLIGLYPVVTEWKWYLATIAVSNMASNILYSYAKAKDKNKLYAIASMVNVLVLALVNILLLVVFPCGVKGYLTANICANVLTSLFLFVSTHILIDIRKASFDKKLLKEMLAYSVPLIANSLSWWVLNSSDRVMITYYCSASDLGLYTAASKIPALLSVITTIFMQAWTVSSIKEYDNEKSKAFYSNVFKYFSLAMFIGGACVLLIVKDFMRIYVGPDYYDAWRYVPLLILGAVFYAFSAFFGAIYGAVKKNLNVTLTTIIAALINIGINYWLMSSNGIMAAALSTAVSYAVIGVFRMFDSKRYFSFDIDLIRFFISAVVLAVQTICVMKGIYIYIASLISVLLIGIINYKDIIGMVKFVKETVRNRRNRV